MLSNTGRIFKKKAYNSDANLRITDSCAAAVGINSQDVSKCSYTSNISENNNNKSNNFKNQLVSASQSRQSQENIENGLKRGNSIESMNSS